MSEPLSPPTASAGGSDPVYRPISGFALGGLILSAAYAAVVLVTATVAIMKGAPIFFPIWTMLFPIAGLVLCLVGRNQIQGSEGTRAGLPLTTWGISLALFSGLGYFAYTLTAGLAVGNQANAFLVGPAESDSGFLTHLSRPNDRDRDIAFLLTKSPGSRINQPGDEDAMRNAYDKSSSSESGSELARFRESVLASMVRRAEDKIVIEPLGVRDWAYERGSYKVDRAYRVKTPEATLEIVFEVNSTEGEVAGQRRQWFVNLPRSPITSKQLTPLGATIQSLRDNGRAYVEGPWRAALKPAKDQTVGAAGDLDKTDKTDWRRVVPDSDEFVKDGKNVHRDYYRRAVRSIFDGAMPQVFSVHFDPTSWPQWSRDSGGRLRMDFPIRMMLLGTPTNTIPTMSGEGVLRLRTKDAFDPASDRATPDWQFVDFEVTRIRSGKGM